MLFRECFQHLYQIERTRIKTALNVSLRLNRGERPDPLPLDLQVDLANSLAPFVPRIQRYPSYQGFYSRLATFMRVSVDHLVVGAGIEEFIRMLFMLCCDPGDTAMVLYPTCAMYDIYAKVFGVHLHRLRPMPGYQSHAEQLIEHLVYLGRPRLVFIPNPGQPVESYYTPDQLRVVAKYCHEHDIVMAVDEAHWGFGAETALPLINEFDNVLVMRTFSKFYGAASIRVGYAMGQPRVIKPLEASRPSGEISGPSMALASTILDHHGQFVMLAHETAQARDYLRDAVRGFGLEAWGSYGFSVLIRFKSDKQAKVVGDALAAAGVYTKYGFTTGPVQDCMLVACGSMVTMMRFFQELKTKVVV